MKKSVKIIIICAVVFAVALCGICGAFLNKFPMTPKIAFGDASASISDNEKILVASYNTAAPWGNLLEGTYTTRRAHLFAQQINNTLPDVLGVQELNSIWAEKLDELLPQYAYYGVKRGGDEKEKNSEINAIYYLEEKYELLESNTFWISLTPEVESKFDGAGCNRICSYVVLKNKQTGFVFAHLNTHLDNVSLEAQNLGGELIAKKAEDLKNKYEGASVVVTGDFNQYEDGSAVQMLKSKGYVNACDVSPDGKATATYHEWGVFPHTEPIDFIFADDSLDIKNYKVHSEKIDSSYVSDHFMITAELNIK